MLPPSLAVQLEQKSGNWENIDEFHEFCRGLVWDTNLLARIAIVFDPQKAKELYQVDDDACPNPNPKP